MLVLAGHMTAYPGAAVIVWLYLAISVLIIVGCMLPNFGHYIVMGAHIVQAVLLFLGFLLVMIDSWCDNYTMKHKYIRGSSTDGSIPVSTL